MKCEKILIIEKRTSFEFIKNKLNFESSRYINLKKSHYEHNEVKTEVLDKIKDFGVEFDLYKDNMVENIDYSKYDKVLILGGDGTFLHGVKYVTSQKVMGINTDLKKSFGKLTRHNIENYLPSLKSFLSGTAKIEEWDRLCVILNGKKLPHIALNEIYIGNDSIKSTSHLFIEVKEERARVLGNGILISTRKGSTALYKSVTKSSFDVKGIGYTIILPFKIMGNLRETQVLSPKEKIRVVPKRQGYSVSFDCDNKRDFEVGQEDEIIVKIDSKIGLKVVL